MQSPDFALQWLEFLGNKVYNKGKRVLEYKGTPDYDITPLSTCIEIGKEIKDDKDDASTYTIMPLPDLDRMGYVIKRRTDLIWKQRQNASYYIGLKTEFTVGINIPRASNIRVQHDPSRKRIRLIGDNVIADPKMSNRDSGVGPWIVYERDAPKSYKKENTQVMFSNESALPKTEQKECVDYKYINEIPVLYSEEKYVVCIPKDEDGICPRFVTTGATRYGKSTFTNALTSRMFLKWGYRVGWLIDPLNQFYDLSLPQDYEGFIDKLNWIGETPKPLPVTHMYLACKNKDLMVHPRISLKLVLNFLEFLNKYEYYTYGTSDWELKGSKRYLKAIIPKMKKAKNSEELDDIFNEAIPQAANKKKDNLKDMIFKWTNTFNSIFNERFTSNLYQDDDLAADTLTVEFKDGAKISGHPFIMAMEAGVVPVINTASVPDKPWVRNYLGDLMHKVMDHQKEMLIHKRRQKFMLVADELQQIFEEKSGKKKDNASIGFETLFRQGGGQDIGFAVNTQSLEKMPKELLKNASYVCCCLTQSKAERKIIRDMFELPDETVSKLGDLKVQEMMIFSNKPFVTYDRWGKRKKEETKKWFKGTIIPPPNYHKAPSS